MGLGPTADEQREAEKQKQRELAQDRVDRRKLLGQEARPEPALDED
jgi:hypothetical protein